MYITSESQGSYDQFSSSQWFINPIDINIYLIDIKF